MKYTDTKIRNEINLLWKREAKGTFRNARRLCRPRDLDRRATVASTHVRNLCPVHLAVFDEALNTLYTLSRVYSLAWWPKRSKERPLFWLFVNRQLALLAAIRRLVLAGLSDPAHALARAFLETSDVAIGLAGDPAFRKLFAYHRRGFDDDDFWKREVAYGRIQHRIRLILLNLKLGTTEIDRWFRARRVQNRQFSRSVHPSSLSAMLNSAVPSLAYPGRFSTDPLGHTSTHIPRLLAVIAMETDRFVAVVIKLILSGTSSIFPDADRQRLDSFFVAALILQQIGLKHEKLLRGS